MNREIILSVIMSAFRTASFNCTSRILHCTTTAQHCYDFGCTLTLLQQRVQFHHMGLFPLQKKTEVRIFDDTFSLNFLWTKMFHVVKMHTFPSHGHANVGIYLAKYLRYDVCTAVLALLSLYTTIPSAFDSPLHWKVTGYS